METCLRNHAERERVGVEVRAGHTGRLCATRQGDTHTHRESGDEKGNSMESFPSQGSQQATFTSTSHPADSEVPGGPPTSSTMGSSSLRTHGRTHLGRDVEGPVPRHRDLLHNALKRLKRQSRRPALCTRQIEVHVVTREPGGNQSRGGSASS